MTTGADIWLSMDEDRASGSELKVCLRLELGTLSILPATLLQLADIFHHFSMFMR